MVKRKQKVGSRFYGSPPKTPSKRQRRGSFVGKVAGAVLGGIVGDIPGAVVGYNLMNSEDIILPEKTKMEGETYSHNDMQGCKFTVLKNRPKYGAVGVQSMCLEREGHIVTEPGRKAHVYVGSFLGQSSMVEVPVAAGATTKPFLGRTPASYFDVNPDVANTGSAIFASLVGNPNVSVHVNTIKLKYAFSNFSTINAKCRLVLYEAKVNTDITPAGLFDTYAVAYQNGVVAPNVGGPAVFATNTSATAPVTSGTVRLGGLSSSNQNEPISTRSGPVVSQYSVPYCNGVLQWKETRKIWKAVKSCPFKLTPGSMYEVNMELAVNKTFKKSYYTAALGEWTKGSYLLALEIETANIMYDNGAGGSIDARVPQCTRGSTQIGWTCFEKHVFGAPHDVSKFPTSFGFYGNPHPGNGYSTATGRYTVFNPEYVMKVTDERVINRLVNE